MSKPRILVLTLAIGADYRRNLEKALQSKRDYCARHGYTYRECHEEVWNRDRPIAWSKVPVWKEVAGQWEIGRSFIVISIWLVIGLVFSLRTFRWSDR